MLKAITVISNNQKEFEQKLEQKVAPKNEPPEQGPVIIFTPHYPQQVYRKKLDKISARNIKTINQIIVNISPIIVNFSKTIGPSNSMPPVLIITESLDHNLTPLDHFIIMNSHKLGLNLQIAPHLSIQLMLIDQFIPY